MAVANTKSTLITNADATPPTISPTYLSGGRLREAVGTVETAAADDDGSVYRFVRLPSHARVSEITILHDSITAGTVYDVGLYRTAEDGGAVVDADCFATNVDISTGTAVGTHVTFEALDIANIEKRLWEVAAASTDPQIMYDLCLTGDTVGSAAGTISVRVRYTDGT